MRKVARRYIPKKQNDIKWTTTQFLSHHWQALYFLEGLPRYFFYFTYSFSSFIAYEANSGLTLGFLVLSSFCSLYLWEGFPLCYSVGQLNCKSYFYSTLHTSENSKGVSPNSFCCGAYREGNYFSIAVVFVYLHQIIYTIENS